VEHATSDELEEKFNKAKMLLAEDKPYEANLFLVDEFTPEEETKLGPRHGQLIEKCSRRIDTIYAETEAKARALAAEKKLDEAKQILAAARRKVDPTTRTKLHDLERELADEW
jgi:hypothetical protein